MTLTPEQFNQLVTKDDLKQQKKEILEEVSKQTDKVLTAVDTVMKEYKEVKEEQTSNQAAHDRMQSDIDMLKNQAGALV